jgi:hypothetical protein
MIADTNIRRKPMGTRGKTEKVSFSLPHEQTEEIRVTVARGEVSSFFTEALRFYLAFRKQTIALEQGYGAWKNEDHSDMATPQDSMAYVNTLRNLRS